MSTLLRRLTLLGVAWVVLLGTAQAHTGTSVHALPQPITLNSQGLLLLQPNQISTRTGRLSPEVLQRRLLLLGYQPLAPMQLTSRLALGTLQATRIAPSYVLLVRVQKAGAQFNIEIDPFTGLIKELR